MLFYLSIIIISAFLYWKLVDVRRSDLNSAQGWLLLILSVLPLVVFEGLRDVTVGFDTQLYGEYLYQEVRHLKSIGDVIQVCDDRGSHDYLFSIVNWLGYLIHDDFHSAFVLCSLIKCMSVGAACILLRNKVNPSLLFLCYLIFFYVTGFNLLRQSISIAISFLAISLFVEKKYYWAIGLLVASYFFHSSSIFVVAIMASFYLKKLKIPVWLYFVLILGCYTFAAQILLLVDSTGLMRDGMADRYMDSGVNASKADILLIIGVLLLGLLNFKVLKTGFLTANKSDYTDSISTQENDNYLYPFFINSAFALTLSFMSSFFEVAFRMAYYPTVFIWIVAFMIIKEKGNKLYIFALISLFLVKFFVDASHGFSDALPYTSRILGF